MFSVRKLYSTRDSYELLLFSSAVALDSIIHLRQKKTAADAAVFFLAIRLFEFLQLLLGEALAALLPADDDVDHHDDRDDVRDRAGQIGADVVLQS